MKRISFVMVGALVVIMGAYSTSLAQSGSDHHPRAAHAHAKPSTPVGVSSGTVTPSSVPIVRAADPGPALNSLSPSAVRHDLSAKMDDEAFRRGVSLFIAAVLACGVVLFVLGCGSRVVVFSDSTDLMMSASIVLAPFLTALVGAGAGVLLGPENHPPCLTLWEEAKLNPALALVIVVGMLTWIWGVLGTIVNSIRYNGLIIGSMVAVLKLGAILLLFLTVLGSWDNWDETENRNVAKLIILGLLIWVASKLINGQRVMERRMMRAEIRAEMVPASG